MNQKEKVEKTDIILKDCYKNISSNERNKILKSLEILDDLTSTKYIENVLNQGFLDLFIKLLLNSNDKEIQLQLLYILINITGSENDYCPEIIKNDSFINKLIQLIQIDKNDDNDDDDDNNQIIFQSLWILTNISLSDKKTKDILFSYPNFIDSLINGTNHIINDNGDSIILKNIKLLKKISQILNSFSVSNPSNPSIIKKILPCLKKHLVYYQYCEKSFLNIEENLLISFLKSLYSLSLNSEEMIQDLLIFLDPIIELLYYFENDDVLIYAIKFLSNIISCGDIYSTQKILYYNGVVPRLSSLISHHSTLIRKDSCFIISNLVLEDLKTVQLLINSGVYLKLISNFKNKDEVDQVKIEILWILTNTISELYNAQNFIDFSRLDIFNFYIDAISDDSIALVQPMLSSITKCLFSMSRFTFRFGFISYFADTLAHNKIKMVKFQNRYKDDFSNQCRTNISMVFSCLFK